MQRVIVIRCGTDLKSRISIHEHVLCRHSGKMDGIATKAKSQREVYDDCEDILEQVTSISMAGLSPAQFEKMGLRAKVSHCCSHQDLWFLIIAQLFSLIVAIDKNYPLPEYQNQLKRAIRDVLTTQYTNGNLTERPKSMKIFQELPLDQRLYLLDSEASLEVAEEMTACLLRIKSKEEQMANGTTSKFWALGRLSLRDAEARTVASLVEWAYDDTTLNFDDAEHLYDIWALATRLEFNKLARECMDRLFKTASARINDAFSSNIGLGYLLSPVQSYSDPADLSDDVVSTVLLHVLKDDNPPAQLSDLVIHALARGLDDDLYAQLESMINLNTSRKLIKALIACKNLKTEQGFDGSLIKYEGQQEAHMT
jgi:hypothetical protein